MKYLMKAGTAGVVIVAALAVAASAPAGVRPDDRAGLRGAGGTSGSIQVRPDDRAGWRGTRADLQGALTIAAVRPDDRAGLRTVSDERNVALGVQQTVRAAPGFDWTAAGAGAGTGAALSWLLACAFLLRRNQRRASNLA